MIGMSTSQSRNCKYMLYVIKNTCKYVVVQDAIFPINPSMRFQSISVENGETMHLRTCRFDNLSGNINCTAESQVIFSVISSRKQS